MSSPHRADAADIVLSTESAVTEATTDSSRLAGVVAGVTSDEKLISLTAAGVRAVDRPDAMTTDTVFALFSTTKAITATVALQLVEDGTLDLDAPAAEYAPRLGDVAVLEGFDSAGHPRVRAPKSAPTTRQLLTHTAGFGYDFFNESYRRLARDHGVPGTITATRESLATPLLFDPGTAWLYGSNVDWAGLVVEGVTGKRLGEVMSERVFSPLGMSDTSFTLTHDTADRRAVLHHRRDDGSLKPNHRWSMPPEPEIHMGGQGLYSTARDYLTFLRMWLDDGRSDGGDQILRPETIAEAGRDQLGTLSVTPLRSTARNVTENAEFFPGVRKSWGLTAMINDEDAPTGRPAGSLGWAGLANLYFWIDRRNRVAGFWATQIFPFFDRLALNAYLDFETSVYRTLAARG